MEESQEFLECTWKDCNGKATMPWFGKDGEQWASLCINHNAELEEAFTSGIPRKIVSAWIKAQGGSEKATERMIGFIGGK